MIDPDLTAVPPEVRELVSALTASGFAVVAEVGGGAVDRRLELAGPWCGVRITADRGRWSVDLGRPPRVGWYDPAVWQACLDDEPLGTEPWSLREEVDFVRSRWTEVAVAPPEVDACLVRARARRARVRLGLPVEEDPPGTTG